MLTESCPSCGGVVGQGVERCPHCGARLRSPLSRAWVFAFFVMGIVIGLLLLVLQQGGDPLALLEGASQPQPVAPVLSKPAVHSSAQVSRGGTVTPTPAARTPSDAPSLPGNVPAAPPETTTEPMACDRRAAQAVRDKARSLALISEQADVLLLHLGSDWVYYSPGHRRGFINAFAEADRCLAGHLRPIRFFFRGEEVAQVDASGAVHIR